MNENDDIREKRKAKFLEKSRKYISFKLPPVQ